MSHDYNIHPSKRIYDQTTSLVDVTKISKHLEATAKDGTKRTKKSDQNKNLRYSDNQKMKRNNENINDYSSSSEIDKNYKKTGYSGDFFY